MPILRRITVQSGHHSNGVVLNHILLLKTQIAAFYIICHRYILSTLVILYYPNCDMWYSIIRENFPMNLHIFSFKYLACQQSGFGFILL